MPALYSVVISGAAPVYPQIGSLQISRSLNQRDTAQFVLYTGFSTAWLLGQTVLIKDAAANVLFGGRIEAVTTALGQDKAGVNQHTQNWWNMSCVSHDKLLDRRYATGSWTGQTMGFIVRSLLSTYLASDGLTASNVQDGPILPQYDVTTLTKISDILADISRQTKFPYYVELIDNTSNPVHTDLHMFDPGIGSTVFSLTEGTAYESISFTQDLVDYRNREFVVTGDVALEETFPGTGAAPQTVNLSNQAASVTSITVDGAVRTVGIQGTDTGKDWYYTVNSTAVVQDSGAAAIALTSTIKILYLPRKADTIHGDGTARAFNTTKAIKTVTSIVLNGGTPLSVGVLGTDALASKDWLYAVNGTAIQQGTGGPVLVLADSLVIDYEPVPGFVMKENTAEQTYRASVEGGTGIHEAVDNAISGGTEDDANALATQMLAKYGISSPGTGKQDVREILFRVTTARESTAPVLIPGARVNVNLTTSRGISGNFLISSSNVADVGGKTLAFDVRLTRDQFVPDFEPFFDSQQSTSQPTATSTAAPTAAPSDSGISIDGTVITF